MPYLIASYFIVMNIVGFCMFGMDKSKARKNKWRIPERTLMLTALLGGSLGCLFGMFLFHHKTLHAKFRFGLPAIFVFQIMALAVILSK